MLVQASQDALRHLEIIMVGTKFPENIGMAARACANTGCGRLTLVNPVWWDREKARPLATAKGEPLLDAVEVKPSLADALGPNVMTYGTTARTGGWRRGLLTPEQAAAEIAPLLHEGSPVAIVFGCEDRGLSNVDIEQCQRLVTIPTAGEASSLNLAQAILILTYECMKAVSREDPQPALGNDPGQQSRRITHEEQALLYAKLKETLLAIDYLKDDNPDYFLMPLRRFLGKSGLRRHGRGHAHGHLCCQVNNLRKTRKTATTKDQERNAPDGQEFADGLLVRGGGVGECPDGRGFALDPPGRNHDGDVCPAPQKCHSCPPETSRCVRCPQGVEDAPRRPVAAQRLRSLR